MENQPPSDLQHLTPHFCPVCREVMGLVNDQDELVICAVRVACGVIYCLACGERVEWRRDGGHSVPTM